MKVGRFVLATLRMAFCAVIAVAFADATSNVVPRRVVHRLPRRRLVQRRERAVSLIDSHFEDDLFLAG